MEIWRQVSRRRNPPGLLGQKQEQESFGHQNQNRQIYQLKAISCVCFPVVFLFQSWGAVCLLRVAIWFEKSYVCTESGYIIPTGGELFRRTWGSVCSSLPAVKSFVANIDQHLNEAACLHSHHLSLEVPIRKIGWYFKSWWMEDMCFHGEMFEWFWSHYSK